MSDRIGRLFLTSGLAFLAIGGALALILRWQLAFPGSVEWISPGAFARAFTTHALVMIFFSMTPLFFGWLGQGILPRLLGASEMAFPRLGALSFVAFLLGGALMVASFLVPSGTAAATWTSLPPLSTVASDGPGPSLVALALIASAISSVLGGVNTLVTVMTRRREGLRLLDLPQLAWGLFLASALNVLFLPVLAGATIMLLADRHCGTAFFSRGGDPLVYQQLFWIFGHPQVYVLILPAWGILGEMLAAFANLAPATHRLIVRAFIAVTALSGFVYGHHLYTAGLGPMLGAAFQALTLAITLPSVILVLAWLHALGASRVRLEPAMLLALGAMIAFGLGGLSGIPLASIRMNAWLHDSAYVVGHFHLTMAAATLLAAMAALTHWLELPATRLARAHAVVSAGMLVLAFGGMLVAGYLGQHRRLWDPTAHAAGADLGGLNVLVSACVAIFALAQVPFAWSVVRGYSARLP